MKVLKNSLSIVGLLLLIAAGCQSSSQAGKNVDSLAQDIMKYEVLSESEPLEFQRTKKLGERDTISFEIKESSAVKMTLSVPGEVGNIRINQLMMPDGEMDGPFGKTYEAHLDKIGTYQVIIAESMMAENPYTGDYQLTIEIE